MFTFHGLVADLRLGVVQRLENAGALDEARLDAAQLRGICRFLLAERSEKCAEEDRVRDLALGRRRAEVVEEMV